MLGLTPGTLWVKDYGIKGPFREATMPLLDNGGKVNNVLRDLGRKKMVNSVSGSYNKGHRKSS